MLIDGVVTTKILFCLAEGGTAADGGTDGAKKEKKKSKKKEKKEKKV